MQPAGRSLPESHTPGQKLCGDCSPKDKVLMCFEPLEPMWRVHERSLREPDNSDQKQTCSGSVIANCFCMSSACIPSQMGSLLPGKTVWSRFNSSRRTRILIGDAKPISQVRVHVRLVWIACGFGRSLRPADRHNQRGGYQDRGPRLRPFHLPFRAALLHGRSVGEEEENMPATRVECLVPTATVMFGGETCAYRPGSAKPCRTSPRESRGTL